MTSIIPYLIKIKSLIVDLISKASEFKMLRHLVLVAGLIAYTHGFCFHQGGGIGEYHKECSQSIGNLDLIVLS